MGMLYYGVGPGIQIEDRALQHLRSVITTKLRRDEAFSFTWDTPPDHATDAPPQAGVHGTIWISRSSTLYFRFDQPPAETLNTRWLVALSEVAVRSGTLRLIPEPTLPRIDHEEEPLASRIGS